MSVFLATIGTLFILAGVILIFALEVITDIQIGIIVCAFGFGFVLCGISSVLDKLDAISVKLNNSESKVGK